VTTKTPPERLREAVSTQLVTYLSEGVVSESAVATVVDPSELTVTDIRRLLRIKFVLSSDVTEFVQRAPDQLRRVRRSSRQLTETERGSVSGRVNWPGTHARRSRAGHDDPTLFATTTQSVAYDIPENRVVKRLLSEVVDVVGEEFVANDHDWQSEWSAESATELTRVYRDNPHLARLPDPESYTVTDRDIDAARRSRRELYQDAAALLRLYRDLLDGQYERAAVQELLRETIIVPSEPARLFELYVVFELLATLDNGSLRYRTVSPGSGAIASLKTPEMSIEVYYDETGPVTLSEPSPEVQPETLSRPFSRELMAARAYDSHREAILGTGSQKVYYRGRPDLVVCVFTHENGEQSLRTVLLGEIKYTRREQTLARGIRELSEYLSFARHDANYLSESDVQLQGVVVTNSGGRVDRHENVVHLGVTPSTGIPNEVVVEFV